MNAASSRRFSILLACFASLVLALLVIGWAQEMRVKTLSAGQIALVLGLIALPGATGAAVLIERTAARRAARAASFARAAEILANESRPVEVPHETRATPMVVRHSAHRHTPETTRGMHGEPARAESV